VFSYNCAFSCINLGFPPEAPAIYRNTDAIL
jgi:hypothetical protein